MPSPHSSPKHLRVAAEKQPDRRYQGGTRVVGAAIGAAPDTTVVGGGDSVSALRGLGLTARITHVLTGGGASLELIEGKKLPSVEVLGDRAPRLQPVVAEAKG